MKTQVQKDMYCKDHICLQRDAVAENGAAERAAADTNATTSNCCVECLHRVEQHNEHALDQQLLSVGSPRLPLCCMHGYLQGTCVLSSGSPWHYATHWAWIGKSRLATYQQVPGRSRSLRETSPWVCTSAPLPLYYRSVAVPTTASLCNI